MEIRRRIPVVLLSLVILSSFDIPAWAYDVRGTVRMEPPYPPAKKVEVAEKYHTECSKEQISSSLIVSPDGFIKNAVIFLEGDFQNESAADPLAPAPTLDQKDCNFEPHVLIVRQNSPFFVANSDPMAHDVRTFDEAKMLYRFEMDAFDKPVEQKSEAPGVYVIRCGLHKWMHAFVVSAKHPFYAVSNEQGEFELRGVPEGTHKLRIWHETLGEAEVSVEVKQSISDFSYVFANGIKNT